MGVRPIKSIKCDMYLAPSIVNVCYAFDIDKTGSMVFAINRCISLCLPKIIKFGQSVLKIPAKNYVCLIILAHPVQVHTGTQSKQTTNNIDSYV